MLSLDTSDFAGTKQKLIGSYFLENGEEIAIPEGQAAVRCHECSSRLLALLSMLAASHSGLPDCEKSDLLAMARDLAFEIDALVPLVEDDETVRMLR